MLAYEPAAVGSLIEESLAKFDTRWQTSLSWNRTDLLPGLVSPNGNGLVESTLQGVRVAALLIGGLCGRIGSGLPP